MFERRLKVILLLLFVATGILLLRAVHLQIVMKKAWTQRADDAMRRPQSIETVRGRIVDYMGKVVAADVASTDACVDYRAVLQPAEPKWVQGKAIDRLRTRLGDAYRKAPLVERNKMIADEVEQIGVDIDAMWERLAEVSQLKDETREQAIARIDDVRQAIIARVEMRRRYLWYRNYENAVKEHAQGDEDATVWERWLLDASGTTPEVDKFIITVAEQQEAHVVLRAIAPAVAADLGRDVEQYPGLALRPSTNRYYPFGPVAAHMLGRLSRVDRDDLEKDPNARKKGDDLRQYFPNDLIGRTGIEKLAEPALRGRRGQIERKLGDDTVISSDPAQRGQDVRLSIDMDLQRDVEALFKHVPIKDFNEKLTTTEMYGAAIVIDVPTGQVRVMASNPGFDPNTLEETYGQMALDEINRPLLNRATQLALEPGSTVKTLVGLSAITAGKLGVHEGIECDGYLHIGGRKQSNGRCWTASKFGNRLDEATGAPFPVAHHQIPFPHKGHHGNADGFLTYSDGLERSCNIFFEMSADRLGMDALCYWYDQWGLGRETGLGITESRGRLPRLKDATDAQKRTTTLFAGIGQGQVAATPIQMANVAATIARKGIWKRPRLFAPDPALPFEPSNLGQDTVDLRLSPEGLAEAKAGMVRVVNSAAGTGIILVRNSPILKNRATIAGKTGTAQAAKFSAVQRDPTTHKPLRDENNRIRRTYFEPLTAANPKGMVWYRGSGRNYDELAHAWYIGFAPADNPRIAFCVFVEYGGSGGIAAAPIATGMLEACVKHGYLPRDDGSVGLAAPSSDSLLYEVVGR